MNCCLSGKGELKLSGSVVVRAPGKEIMETYGNYAFNKHANRIINGDVVDHLFSFK